MINSPFDQGLMALPETHVSRATDPTMLALYLAWIHAAPRVPDSDPVRLWVGWGSWVPIDQAMDSSFATGAPARQVQHEQ